MKAEERKELEANALNRWLSGMKEKLKGRLLYLIVGSVVLITAACLIIYYYIVSIRSANSARIMELTALINTPSAEGEKKLDEIINSEKHQGKPTVTWAKLQKARMMVYRDGLEKLGTIDADARKAAVAKLEEGRKLYLDIVNDLKDNTSLQQEAWISCALVEEALLGTPKEERNNEFRGSFDKMLEDYRKAAAIHPDSEVSKRYAAKLTDLQSKRAEIEKLYQDLYRLSFTGKIDLK